MPPRDRHPLAVEFGHRVRVRRVERRLSRAQLGGLLGVTEERIGKIERGDGITDLQTVVALQEALDCPWDDLLRGLATHRDPTV